MNVLRSSLVALVLALPGVAANHDSDPLHFVLTLTDFGGGTQTQVGNQLLIRDLVVLGNLSGGVVGTDQHNYNSNLDLTTFKGITWGTVQMQVTVPCVGAFDGVFHGRNKDGDFPDQDRGTITAWGSGGCVGKKIKGTYTEPQDGVFHFDGAIITGPNALTDD